jgi:hypothetical protein
MVSSDAGVRRLPVNVFDREWSEGPWLAIAVEALHPAEESETEPSVRRGRIREIGDRNK